MSIVPNTCFRGNCKWRKQGKECVHCSHPNAVHYIKIEKPCDNCGRFVNVEEGGCGACIGRGSYVYPYAYEECDCGGYEQKEEKSKWKNILRIANSK